MLNKIKESLKKDLKKKKKKHVRLLFAVITRIKQPWSPILTNMIYLLLFKHSINN